MNVPEMLVAKSFVVVDDDDKPRISMCVVNGQPSISMNDSNGIMRVYLGLSSDKLANLGLSDHNGVARIMAMADDKFVTLTLADANGLNKLKLVIDNKSENTSIVLSGSKPGESEAILISLDKDGNPSVNGFDRSRLNVFKAEGP